MPRFRPPGVCPVCGEDVPRGAKACPECGSCENSGWSEDADYDGLDLPDQEFDYDKFVSEEFGERTGKQRLWTNVWWWVALIVFLSLAGMTLRGLF